MNDKRLIINYVIEIILCLAILLSSVYIWKNQDLDYYSSLAKEYANNIRNN